MNKRLSEAQEKLRKSLIRQIHLTDKYQRYYKENDEEYRALLKEHFGVESSTKLEIDDLIALLGYLKGKNKLRARKEKASRAQLYELRRLWRRYADDASDIALVRFLKRYNAGALVLYPEHASAKAVQKAIVALKRTLARRENGQS